MFGAPSHTHGRLGFAPSLGTCLGFGLNNQGPWLIPTYLGSPPRVQVSTAKTAQTGHAYRAQGAPGPAKWQQTSKGDGGQLLVSREQFMPHIRGNLRQLSAQSHPCLPGGSRCSPPSAWCTRPLFHGITVQHLAPRCSALQAAHGVLPAPAGQGGSQAQTGHSYGCARPPGGQRSKSWRASRPAAGVRAAAGPGPTTALAVRLTYLTQHSPF